MSEEQNIPEEKSENRKSNPAKNIQPLACADAAGFITNTKLIEFFGVIVLLIVFELLNLLLHPFLERITHHSPLLMLLALVCIAALLVPLHHRLQKWATHKLVEKNKKIRLANAKKTIEQLEKDKTN